MFPSFIHYGVYTILIPLVLTFLRYKKTDQTYHPFFWLIWLGTLGDISHKLSAKLFRTNAMSMNVYTILEALLVMYIFYRWDLFRKGLRTYYWIAGIYLAIFLVENAILMGPHDFNALGPVIFSFTIALTTIQMINKLIVESTTPLLKESMFYVCCGFILYFTYNALVEIFYFYGINRMKWVQFTVNSLSNLLYAAAVLWTPRRKDSLLPTKP
jgi:hypothetical protein